MAKTILDFDRLHRLDDVIDSKRFPKPIPYRDYFGAMYITPEEMRTRIDLAEEIEDVMLWVFAYWIIAEEAEISVEEVKRDAEEKLTSVIAKHTILDPYLEKHIADLIGEVIDVTERHAKKKREDEDEESDIEEMLKSEESEKSEGEKYWTSRERAMLISENEANAFEEYIKFRDAKAEGKTKKTWITELDDKVRFTHTLAEGQTVDIDGLFLIGGSEMRFPKDSMYDPDPSEVVNCRCTCEYS